MNKIVEEYKTTLNRAKTNNIDYIWSGDLRNAYLRECLNWAISNNIVECEFTKNYIQQESGYKIKWLI